MNAQEKFNIDLNRVIATCKCELVHWKALDQRTVKNRMCEMGLTLSNHVLFVGNKLVAKSYSYIPIFGYVMW